MDVTAAEGSMIPMTSQLEHSGWPLIVPQWAGLLVPPMSASWRTAVFFRNGRKLYICPVYTWWNSLETALVTGSLLFITPGCCLAELSDCEIVLRVSCVSADLLLCVMSSVSLTIPWRHCATGMATGSGRPAVDRPGVDFEVQLQVS